MDKDRIKKLFGIFWFFVFIYFIYSVGLSGRTDNDTPFRKYLKERWTALTSYFNRDDRVTFRPVINQQVIREESTITQVVDKVSPAVVSIVATTVGLDFFNGVYSSEAGIGTGFIVDSSGIIITNSHVVEDPSAKYSIVTKDGQTYEVDKVHLDQVTDIAILEVAARDLPVVEFGDSDALKVGQSAIAIGNALGQFQNTVTVGVISGISRQITAGGRFNTPTKTYDSVIQTDAALNPGNSGGPLLNSAGQVVGVSVATTPGADNISFAIPINTVKPILDIFAEEGRIIRPYLGVEYVMVTPEVAKLRDLPEGAFVNRIVKGSPAEAAGITRGDIIVKLGGEDVNSKTSLGSLIARYKVGDRVEVTIDRAGTSQNLTAELAESPSTQQPL